MSKFIEKKITIILLGITCYFLYSISNSIKESAKYNSDLRACAKMKAFQSNKDSSKLYQKQVSEISGVDVEYINEYCKKLTQQNLF
tara:strand:+ start:544 stop:801 length:258 start_codon:yes stop_codon:yes gene_type:complete